VRKVKIDEKKKKASDMGPPQTKKPLLVETGNEIGVQIFEKGQGRVTWH